MTHAVGISYFSKALLRIENSRFLWLVFALTERSIGNDNENVNALRFLRFSFRKYINRPHGSFEGIAFQRGKNSKK